MTDYVNDSVESVSIGNILSRAGSVMSANLPVMFGIALVFGALPSVAVQWLQSILTNTELDRLQSLGIAAITLGGWILGIVFQSLVTGALIRATVAHTQGRKATFAESAQAGLVVALPLVFLSFLLAFGVGLGLILFVVPGIMLYCAWSVAAPALVEERCGVLEAFTRSRDLTRGARWRVFGLEAFVWVCVWIFSGISVGVFGISGLETLAAGRLSIGWIAWSVAISTITMAVSSTVQASLYVELRAWKEGPSDVALAEIFA